jgi:hypothetical protein
MYCATESVTLGLLCWCCSAGSSARHSPLRAALRKTADRRNVIRVVLCPQAEGPMAGRTEAPVGVGRASSGAVVRLFSGAHRRGVSSSRRATRSAPPPARGPAPNIAAATPGRPPRCCSLKEYPRLNRRAALWSAVAAATAFTQVHYFARDCVGCCLRADPSGQRREHR